jgi:prepilin-type N-terminal cleavage/methylation domain-containing protein
MMKQWNMGSLKWRESERRSCPYPRIPPSRPSNRKAGFTLIELLVALTLTAILTAAVAGVLGNTSDAVDNGNETIRQLSRMRALDLLLGSALREAVSVELSSSETQLLMDDFSYSTDDGTIRFRGEPDSLGFCLNRPFLEAERDGYMHWIVLEVREDEERSNRSLWLRDVSFLEGLDNPVGEDYGGLRMLPDECLPVQEVCLIREVQSLSFSYWALSEEDYDDDEEIDEDLIEGDYAEELPDYVVFKIKLPHSLAEELTMDVAVLEDDEEDE